MAGLSSKALAFGGAENKKKYQQYEFNSDLDLNLYESFYRSHDPQLGRFWQIDPKAIDEISPYCSMGNNPIMMTDALGDTTEYYDANNNLLYTTYAKGYTNVFIVADDYLSIFKNWVSGMGDADMSKQVVFDKLLLIGGAVSGMGDAYDMNSIRKFYAENVNKFNLQSIGNDRIDDMRNITVGGKPVTADYLKSLKGAEVTFNMVSKGGVWVVDESSIQSKNDLSRGYQGASSVPNGHLHPGIDALQGKEIRYSLFDKNTGRVTGPHSTGPISKYVGPSGNNSTSGDVGIANQQNKVTGTLRNIVVNYSHIYLYTGTPGNFIRKDR